MALASSITLSAARISGIFDVTNLAQSAIPEGAVVQYQTSSTDDNDVLLPTAANQFNIAGVSMGAGQIPLGTASAGNDFLAVQKLGRAKVLLAASTTVTRGQQCVVANSSGYTTFRNPWTTSAQVLGYFAQSHTSGSTAEYVMVDLALAPVEIAQPIVGQSVTAIGAATKYLVAGGTAAASATAVVLFVCPQAGVLRTLTATATTAAGGSDTGIVTVYRNAVSGNTYAGFATTALTCTLTSSGAGSNFIQDTTHTVACNAGDLIAIQVVSSGATLAGVNGSVLFT